MTCCNALKSIFTLFLSSNWGSQQIDLIAIAIWCVYGCYFDSSRTLNNRQYAFC